MIAVSAIWSRNVWLVPAVLLFAWLSVLAFLRSIDPDEAVYRVVADGILHGRWPYRDMFDHKPPFVYFWYLPAGFGASIQIERVLAALMMSASVFPVFVLARRWLTGRQVPLAVAAYALLLANPFMSLGANSEAFMLLPLGASLAVSSPFAAGLLLGIAIMTKPVAICFVPALILLWKRQCWKSVLGIGVVFTAVLLIFLPVIQDFWEANVLFNMRYGRATPLTERLLTALVPNPFMLLGMLPIWIAAGVGAFRLKSKILGVWALAGLVAAKAAGPDGAYYFAPLLPAAALFAGAGLDFLMRAGRPYRLALAVTAVISLTAATGGLVYFSGQRENYEAIDHVVKVAVGDTVYVAGDQAELYVYVHGEPDERFFFSVPLALTVSWSDQARSRLLACPPDVLIVPNDPRSPYPLRWSREMEALYANRQEFEVASVLTMPRIAC